MKKLSNKSRILNTCAQMTISIYLKIVPKMLSLPVVVPLSYCQA